MNTSTGQHLFRINHGENMYYRNSCKGDMGRRWAIMCTFTGGWAIGKRKTVWDLEE